MMLAAAALIKDAAHTKFAVDGSAVAGPLFKRFGGDRVGATPVVIENLGPDTLDAVVASTGVPIAPEPAGGDGFKIERHYYSVDGEEIDIKTVAQNDRVVVVDTVTAETARTGRILVVDRIPAGYEIENPDVSKSGDVEAFDWLSDVVRNAAHTEARTDRFVAALNRDDERLARSTASPSRCAPSRRASSPSRRQRWKTCTARASRRAPKPEPWRSSARPSEAAMTETRNRGAGNGLSSHRRLRRALRCVRRARGGAPRTPSPPLRGR